MKNSRFITVYKESSTFSDSGKKMILVDRETGVNYLWICSGYAGGLSPLLDSSGRPVVTYVSGSVLPER